MSIEKQFQLPKKLGTPTKGADVMSVSTKNAVLIEDAAEARKATAAKVF